MTIFVRCKRSIQFLLIISLLLMNAASHVYATEAGKDSGGGGGEVHDKFIAAGMRVVFYLENTDRGRSITSRYNLNLCRLKATLNEDLVFVYDDRQGMSDDRSSIINATGFKWRIHIGESYWLRAFRNSADVYHLVFKEMLRSEQSNFDKALEISLDLLPFPRELFIDRELQFQSTEIDLNQCLSDSEKNEIQTIRSNFRLYSQASMPQCAPGNLTASSMYSGWNAADDLMSLVGQTRCAVSVSECRVFEGRNLITDAGAIPVKSIQWRGKVIYTVPMLNEQEPLLRNENRRLAELFEAKKAQLSAAGICRFAATEGAD